MARKRSFKNQICQETESTTNQSRSHQITTFKLPRVVAGATLASSSKRQKRGAVITKTRLLTRLENKKIFFDYLGPISPKVGLRKRELGKCLEPGRSIIRPTSPDKFSASSTSGRTSYVARPRRLSSRHCALESTTSPSNQACLRRARLLSNS